MRKEHRVRIPVPYFLGAHIDISAVRININEKLCCIKYLIYRIDGMFASDYREKRNCIEDKKERACYFKEVAHHEVSRPRSLEFRQTVENIESIKALFLDDVMDVHRKRLKSVRKRYCNCLNFRSVFDKCLVTCESEIDYIALIFYRLLDIRFHEQFKLLQVRHAPDDIIAEPDIVERLIHLRNAAQDPVKRCHGNLPSILLV